MPPLVSRNGSMIMNHELERMSKEVIMIYVMVSIPIFLPGETYENHEKPLSG
jgi:hypothetical protein